MNDQDQDDRRDLYEWDYEPLAERIMACFVALVLLLAACCVAWFIGRFVVVML